MTAMFARSTTPVATADVPRPLERTTPRSTVLHFVWMHGVAKTAHLAFVRSLLAKLEARRGPRTADYAAAIGHVIHKLEEKMAMAATMPTPPATAAQADKRTRKRPATFT